MFVIQVDFKDGVNQVETAFIKRLFIKVGTKESSHLILDGVHKLDFELAIYKGIGNKFKCRALTEGLRKNFTYPWEREYDGIADINLGAVNLSIISISAEIANRESDLIKSKDILSEISNVSTSKSNLFPAFYSLGNPKVGLSVGGVDQLFIGNTRNCLLRFDDFKSKSEYAKLSFKANKSFEISPISSQERVFVNDKEVVGTKVIEPKDRISFSSGQKLIYLSSEKDIYDLSEELPDIFFSSGNEGKRNIRVVSGPISPGVLPIKVGQTISIGRDPGHNVWIDAAFISRLHCTIYVEPTGYVITDFSANGVWVNGAKLDKNKPMIYPSDMMELSFGHGAVILVSEFDDAKFKDFHNRNVTKSIEREEPKISDQDVRKTSTFEQAILEQNNPGQFLSVAKQEIIEPEVEEAVNISENKNSTFEEYQKRSIRILEESGAQLFSVDPLIIDESNREEFPIRVGFARYLPQIFIASLILAILGFFIILGMNLVR